MFYHIMGCFGPSLPLIYGFTVLNGFQNPDPAQGIGGSGKGILAQNHQICPFTGLKRSLLPFLKILVRPIGRNAQQRLVGGHRLLLG